MFNDCDVTIHYHPRKANKVVDALNRRSTVALALILARQMDELSLKLVESADRILTIMTIRPTLIVIVKMARE